MTDSTSHSHPASGDEPLVGVTDAPGAVEVVRSEEQLSVSTVWEPYRRVRVSKRIVHETRTVTVEVRREKLVVEDLEAPGATGGVADIDQLGLPIQFDLCEEQVTVTKVVVPVERVRVDVYQVAGAATVSMPLAHDEIAVEGSEPGSSER